MKVFILLSLVAGALAVLDCPVHQHYESCGTACPLTCDNHNDPPQGCILMCNPGCHCDPGYVKTKSGSCVKPESCNTNEVCTGENQRYNECGTACPLTCDNYQNPPKACTKQCVIGCECQEGYVKNKQGQCVLPSQCPSFASNALCELEAEPGRCRGYFPRYFFNKDSGKCEQFIFGGCGGNENNFKTLAACHDSCGSTIGVCGRNQKYVECGTACPMTCDNMDDPPKICTAQCVAGCVCEKHYVKNAEGECVEPEKCPAYDLCLLDVATGSCKGHFPRYHFNKTSGHCEEFIYGGCSGNANNFGTLQKCQQACADSFHVVCGENEEFQECGTACPLTCDNIDNPPKACTKQCVIGCQCQKGYVKNAQGKCVLPEQCPSKAVCGQNQEFQECGTACPLTCDNFRNPPKFCTLQCVIGCACQEGYVKNAQGECVLPEQCPSQAVCGENQEFQECGTACPLTCENLDNPPEVCTLQCVIGCACQKGYVKNSEGECVKPEQCKAHNLCELKAETGMCRGYFPRYHFNKATGQCEKFVYGGCGGNGNNFETIEECQKSCGASAHAECGENQEFQECGTACPLTCDNYRDPIRFCTKQCIVGCACQEGYVQNAQGECVLPEQCPSQADNLCQLKAETGPCMAYMERYHFNKAIGQCEKFVYGGCGGNANNFKTLEECQNSCQTANAVCGENQEFHECGTACPLTCDNYKNPPKFCTLQCVIGCACQKGYVKTSDGRCVLPEQCESLQNALDRPDCDKAPETGVCKASHTRWYYDQEEGMCKIFIYGGCGGNRNNFESRDECYNKCGALAPPKNALCAQEKVVGPCRAAFPRFFYNQKTGQCEKFIYGGCRGNGNNFLSLEDCHATCLA